MSQGFIWPLFNTSSIDMVIASAASWIEISFQRRFLNTVQLINTVYVRHWNRCMLGNDASLMQQVFWKNAWGIPFQRSGNVNGWVWRPYKGRCISSQTCSIGDKSGDIAGQGSILTMFWIKKSVMTSARHVGERYPVAAWRYVVAQMGEHGAVWFRHGIWCL